MRQNLRSFQDSSRRKRSQRSSLELSRKSSEFGGWGSGGDFDEPPPMYNSGRDSFNMGNEAADPYNFEMSLPKKKSKSKRKKKKKDTEKKPTMTVEERMANILKRTGSTLTDDFIRSSGQSEEVVMEAADELEDKGPPEPATQLDTTSAMEDEKAPTEDPFSLEGSDDSLAMEEADFEVGAYARRRLAETNELRSCFKH